MKNLSTTSNSERLICLSRTVITN